MQGTFYEAPGQAERCANERSGGNIFKRRPTINHV
jgi:hypothetical protein